MPGHRIFSTPFASIYPLYVTEVEHKGRSRADVDSVVTWLTGYDEVARGRAMSSILRGSGPAGP